jgi:hypothetical protein
MSTDYVADEMILATELFDGRLRKYGILRRFVPGATNNEKRCLTDGVNNLWVFVNDDDSVVRFTRYLPSGDPSKILDVIQNAFKTRIYSEHQPQYWGFETEEEWHQEIREMAKQDRKRFQKEVLNLLRGKPHDIEPGTNGMAFAKIARSLVTADPSLLSAKNHSKLFKAAEKIYRRNHAKWFKIPDEVARANGDLPNKTC